MPNNIQALVNYIIRVGENVLNVFILRPARISLSAYLRF
jgi:hypothetical protein